MTNKEYVDGLRRLADWYEQHPGVQLPFQHHPTVYAYSIKEDALAIASILGHSKKEFNGANFYLIKEFGEVKLRFYFSREAICERVVTGTKVIPAVSYPERIEEIIEWKCHPLLEADATKT